MVTKTTKKGTRSIALAIAFVVALSLFGGILFAPKAYAETTTVTGDSSVKTEKVTFDANGGSFVQLKWTGARYEQVGDAVKTKEFSKEEVPSLAIPDYWTVVSGDNDNYYREIWGSSMKEPGWYAVNSRDKRLVGWSENKYSQKNDITDPGSLTKGTTVYAIWSYTVQITLDGNGLALWGKTDENGNCNLTLLNGSRLGDYNLPPAYKKGGTYPDDEVGIDWALDPEGKELIPDIREYIATETRTLYAIKKPNKTPGNQETEVIETGTCGENLIWTLDSDGVLTISGEGEMEETPWNDYWSDYKDVIKEVVLENGLTSIASGAFNGCSNITNVTIPKSVTSIETSAFGGCCNLTSIEVDRFNTVYDSRDNSNAIIETNSNELIVGCSHTVIPESVRRIGDSAFAGCKGLTIITIPKGVTHIGEDAFFGCSALEVIGLPKTLTYFGAFSFEFCKRISDVYYEGTEADIAKVNVASELTKARWHYNSNLEMLHIHEWDEGTITERATCSRNGIRTYICRICKKTKTEKIPAAGHTWGNGKITKAPSAVSAGVKTYTCTVCKQTKTEPVKKLTPTIKLSVTKKTIKIKKTIALIISNLAKGDSIKSVKSNKTRIATVKKVKGNKYKITGKKKGKAIITVTLKSGKKAQCVVLVK